jgi:hypothetical protein
MGMSSAEYFWQDHDLVDARLQDIEETLDELWKAVKGDNVVPLPRRAGGRPPKSFTARLAFFAGAWMEANATESAAELVRAMEAECDRRGWQIGDTQLREMAADFIEEFRALRRRD